MWYVHHVLYAVLYVRVSCFVVCGCGVSRKYIDVYDYDMFSVVNATLAQWGERSLSERTAQVRFPVRPDKTYTVFC